MINRSLPAETELTPYQRFFLNLSDGAVIHHIIRDASGQPVDTQIMAVNPAWEQIMGSQGMDIIGTRLSSLVLMQPLTSGNLPALYGRVADTGEPVEIEVVSADGSRFYRVMMVKLAADVVGGVFHEITASKRTEQTQQSIFNAVSDAVFVYDAETGCLLDLNFGAEAIIGQPRAAVLNLTNLPGEPPEFAQARQDILSRSRAGEHEQARLIAIAHGADYSYYELRVRVAETGGHQRVVILIHDVTEAQRQLKALAESEERYRTVSEMVSDYTYAVTLYKDGRGTFDWSTAAFSTLTGYDLAEVVAVMNQNRLNLHRKLVHPEDQPKVAEALGQLTQDGTTEFKFRQLRKDGTYFWAKQSARLFPLPDGTGYKIYGIVKDITDHIQAENNYLAIFNGVNDNIFVHSAETGQIIDLNIRAAMTMGYPRDEIIGKLRLPHETYATARYRAGLIHRAAAGEIVEDESPYLTPDGETLWIESRMKLAQIGDEKRVIVVARDITERKEALKAVQQSEERYRNISELITDFAFSSYYYDRAIRRIDWITGPFERITGYTIGEIQKIMQEFGGQYIFKHIIYPEDQWKVARDLARLAHEGSVVSEYRMVSKDRQVVWVRAYYQSISERDGMRVTGAIKNITEQIQAENNYRTVFEAANDAMMVLDPSDGSVLDANRLADALLVNAWSISPEKKLPAGLFPALPYEDFLAAVQAAANGASQDHEWQAVSDANHPTWYDVRMTAVEFGGQKRVLTVFRDITESRQVIDSIRESEERYRSVSDGIPDWAFLLDVNESGFARLVWSSASVESMTGRSEAEIRAGCAREGFSYLHNLIHPEDLAAFRESHRRVHQEETHEVDLRLVKPSGEAVWAHTYLRALRDPSGKISGICGVIRDISERMRAENNYRCIFEAVNDGIFVIDTLTGEFLDVNQRGCQMLGIEREELIGQNAAADALLNRMSKCWGAMLEAARQGQAQEKDCQVTNRFGVKLWVNIRLTRLLMGGEERILTVFRDVTSRKQDTEALRVSETRHRKIAELLTDFAFAFQFNTVTQRWQVDWITESVQAIIGFSPVEIERELNEYGPAVLNRYVHNDDLATTTRSLSRLSAETPTASAECRLITKGGQPRWFRLMITAEIKPDRPEPRFIFGCAQDITDQKHLEAALTRQVEAHSTLAAVDLAFNASLDERVILAALMNQSMALLQIDAACYYQVNKGSASLSLAAQQGFYDPDHLPAQIGAGEGLAGLAALNRTPQVVTDLTTRTAHPADPALAVERFQSAYAAPLLARGRLTGVLCLYRRTVSDFPPVWAELAGAVIMRAALALDTAALVSAPPTGRIPADGSGAPE